MALRRVMLRDVHAPVVMETHAGDGAIFSECYRGVPFGVALEKDKTKAERLALVRPEWAVYACDSVVALGAGLAADVPVNVLDLDPYGEPWPALAAFLRLGRNLPDVLHVVANDGLRQKTRINAWDTRSLRPAVERFGNDLWDRYLDVCRFLAGRYAGEAGYRLARWHAYHCGAGHAMTHWLARLERA